MRSYGNEQRNADVLKLVAKKRLSYAVIGEMMGIPRSAVAGIVFRNRYSYDERVACVGYLERSKIGHGHRPRSYYPEKTASNTR